MNFQKTLSGYQKIINQELEKYLEQKSKILPSRNHPFVKQQYRLLKTQCLSNGKRLRPILTIMAYQAVGGLKEKNIYTPALAFELYHNYTLIHDDIYDEDKKRRNITTNHIVFQKWFEKEYPKFSIKNELYKNSATRFGVVSGIINGKYLSTISALPILEADIPDKQKIEGMKLHQNVSIYDNTGQAIDLFFENSLAVKKQDYINMVIYKTGELFKASIEWGAILGKATVKQRFVLKNYMFELAIAFQIRDDLMDIAVADGSKGRNIGSDIRKGKKTLLIIHALKKANTSEKKIILNTLGRDESTNQQIKKVIDLLYSLGSVDYCQKVAKQKIKKALYYLHENKSLLKSEPRQFFSDLAWFMLEREK